MRTFLVWYVALLIIVCLLNTVLATKFYNKQVGKDLQIWSLLIKSDSVQEVNQIKLMRFLEVKLIDCISIFLVSTLQFLQDLSSTQTRP